MKYSPAVEHLLHFLQRMLSDEISENTALLDTWDILGLQSLMGI